MNKLVEHDRRLSKLEFNMGGVRKHARKTSEDVADIKITLDAHTATLDSHSAKLDVHKSLLEALRETQVEQGSKMDEGFAAVRRENQENYSTLAVGMAQMTALLRIAIDLSEKPND